MNDINVKIAQKVCDFFFDQNCFVTEDIICQYLFWQGTAKEFCNVRFKKLLFDFTTYGKRLIPCPVLIPTAELDATYANFNVFDWNLFKIEPESTAFYFMFSRRTIHMAMY